MRDPQHLNEQEAFFLRRREWARHTAQALGNRACRIGHSTLFVKSTKLFRKLHTARADGSWEKTLQKPLKPDLLIIDDFGLTALTMAQAGECTRSSPSATSVARSSSPRIVLRATGYHSSRTGSGQLGHGSVGAPRPSRCYQRSVLSKENATEPPSPATDSLPQKRLKWK